MKKIVYLLLVLVVVIFSICACDNNTDNIENEIIKENDDNNKRNDLEIEKKDIEDKTIENFETISGEENKDLEEIPEETVSQETSIDTEIIEVTSSSLSNKTNAWGFVRKKDNAKPEFASQYTKVLDDYEGIYVGNKDDKKIYLTFDEGYENGYTDDILDTLKEKDVEAVFFVTMPYVKQNKELVQRMIDEGHIVGNHTVNHPSMPEVTDDEKLKKEIMDLHNYVKENFNYEMEFLRPPKGEYSERTVKISLDLGYKTVLWSSAYDDWDVNKQGRLDYARKMILNNLHNGCVMLLHAVSKDNTELLGEIIDEVRNRGYEFCSLEEFEY